MPRELLSWARTTIPALMQPVIRSGVVSAASCFTAPIAVGRLDPLKRLAKGKFQTTSRAPRKARTAGLGDLSR